MIDLNELLPEVLKYHQTEIDAKSAKIEYISLPTIFMYKISMAQIFQNLIGNALKYSKTDTPPLIHVACTESESSYQFSVSDNGIGIHPDFHEKIFALFQRLHNKSEYSGTGLGLSIVQKILQNNKGKIWVESEENKGSTFYFTLPK
ncbi:Signal transduction histidine kinase [Indibacter alkaliphilus LW1]|uniref:histidine kinase n=1 Tax=Indibacter alkaliphilus (strain CCUG 57479 / KCTC 22604 / LW1) TaxID=1189612 RepID=S2DEC7_INDAL|nr:ATP-binding protein [Indibacter alkaliphilus]EOZ95360.1 Signal transduction histidine kinase [Indibacter alkaliphilus LW1]